MSSLLALGTDLKVADIVRMSPSATKITLCYQTMMSSVSGSCLLTGGASVEWAFRAMVTKIQVIVTLGGGVDGRELCTRTLEVEEVIIAPWQSWFE